MEALTVPETSPTPSSRNLKNVFSKARRGRRDNNSTISFNSVDNNTEGNRSIRSSIDAAVDKLKSRNNEDLEDGDSSSSGGLKKLVPGHSKRKKKRRLAEEQQLEEETQRGRSITEKGPVGSFAFVDGSDTLNASQTTLDGDGESSLITIDSNTEPQGTTASPLVSHQSHIGYLTSSSPLIKTSATDANGKPPAPLRPPSISSTPSLVPSKSPTFPALSSSSSFGTNLNPPVHAATIDPSKTEALSVGAREDRSRSRGVSPGTRLKEAFIPSAAKKDTSRGSPERDIAKTSGNGLGTLFNKGDIMSTLSSRRGSRVSENAPLVPTPVDADGDRPLSSGRSLPSLDTTPKTPPSASSEAPLVTTTPPTPIGDNRPTDRSSPSRKPLSPPSASADANTVISPSGNMISHRRIRSETATHHPSKLSNFVSAPLTPTIEENKTPGVRTPSGNLSSPGGPSGFFSSVFSAAQNAANTLTNTISNNPPRSRSGTQSLDGETGSTVDETSASIVPEGSSSLKTEQKQLAVSTMGSGNLSLRHLGISPDATADEASEIHQEAISMQRDEAAARAENVSAARAVSAAYSEKPSEELSSTPTATDYLQNSRPDSTYESSLQGNKTPPNDSAHDSNLSIRRSGSVRSRVGAVTRRHRNSSSATGNTVGTAILAAHTGFANPSVNGSTPKLTGFAVASKKRNKDFHQLFRSVPEDDYLIEDYSCALQRDIILAGRIYISEGHICFSSNILGWVTTLIISFDEVVSLEKENTAMVFPNAIAIQTLHARHTFRSLLTREATYDLIVGIWKISHPSLKSSINGVRLDEGGTGDKTEKVDPSGSEAGSGESIEDEEVYDEDEDDDAGDVIEDGNGSIDGSDAGEVAAKSISRKTSAIGVAVGVAAGGVPTVGDSKAGEKAGATAAVVGADFPGPATHGPTDCTDGETHYEKVIKDELIPAPLGKVYSMLFGPASGGFMGKWLLDEIKVTDLQMEDDKKGLSSEVKSRSFSYIKPLYGAIGPKSTKCIISENLDFFDLERAVSVTCTTQTPDVPSGNVFSTKTKYCLSWGAGNQTRFFMTCAIEWTSKSWLKSPIEKGANDGQTTYGNDLVKSLRAGVSSRPRAGTVGSKAKTKGKTRRSKGEADAISKRPSAINASNVQQANDNWGMLEPVHGILGPVVDIFKPLVSANMIIGFLLFLLVLSWFRKPRSSSALKGEFGLPGLSTPQRIAAYEEIWRREESELWDWLEERAGMRGVAYPASYSYSSSSSGVEGKLQAKRKKEEQEQRQRLLYGRDIEARLQVEKMSEREVESAIGVTEKRLEALKDVMVGRKMKVRKDNENDDLTSEPAKER